MYRMLSEFLETNYPGDSKWMNEMFSDLDKRGYFEAPASAYYHGSTPGGLFLHSFVVAKTLVKLTKANNLVWQDERSPIIIGLFHDLCKMDEYIPTYEINSDAPPTYKHTCETLYKGHGDKSVMILSEYMSLTAEEIACIRYHMGAFTDKEEWNYYTRAVNMCPNVLWTHHADMLAAHVTQI